MSRHTVEPDTDDADSIDALWDAEAPVGNSPAESADTSEEHSVVEDTHETLMGVWSAVASENTLGDAELAAVTETAFSQEEPDAGEEDDAEPVADAVPEPEPVPVARPAAEADSERVYAAVTKAQRSLAVIDTTVLYPEHADEVRVVVEAGRELLAELRNLLPVD